jgi:hypothetical protein
MDRIVLQQRIAVARSQAFKGCFALLINRKLETMLRPKQNNDWKKIKISAGYERLKGL